MEQNPKRILISPLKLNHIIKIYILIIYQFYTFCSAVSKQQVYSSIDI